MASYHIHNNGESEGETMGCESAQNNHEEQTAKAVAELVCEALNIGWKDRRIVEGLIFTSIKEEFLHRDKLLGQYLHTQLDKLADTIKSQLNLPTDVKVNYGYATHAKFNDIIDDIKLKMVITDDEYNSDMEHWAEEYECAMMHLDDLNIPKEDENGIVYSLVGRTDEALLRMKNNTPH